MSKPVKEFKDGLDLVFIKDGVIYPVYLNEDQMFVFNNLLIPMLNSDEMGKIAVMGNYTLEAKKVNV